MWFFLWEHQPLTQYYENSSPPNHPIIFTVSVGMSKSKQLIIQNCNAAVITPLQNASKKPASMSYAFFNKGKTGAKATLSLAPSTSVKPSTPHVMQSVIFTSDCKEIGEYYLGPSQLMMMQQRPKLHTHQLALLMMHRNLKVWSCTIF